MKKVRRDIYGRRYTTFGYYLHLAITVIGFLSFFTAIGYCGTSDLGGELEADKIAICTIVFGACVFLHNKIFE